MAQAFFGGVHPNDMKAATNEKAIEQLEAPAEVVIPMSMHIGAPCKPIVAVGDKVTIHTDGLQVTATTTGGVAEVVWMEGTASGAKVRVRFPGVTAAVVPSSG